MPDDGFGSWPFIRYTVATMARVLVVHWGTRKLRSTRDNVCRMPVEESVADSESLSDAI